MCCVLCVRFILCEAQIKLNGKKNLKELLLTLETGLPRVSWQLNEMRPLGQVPP